MTSELSGEVGHQGPMIYVKIMQTPARVQARKKAGLGYTPPVVIPGLIDTGASRCAVDRHIIARLDPRKRSSMSIHTPGTNGGYVQKYAYDMSIVIGEDQPEPLAVNVLAVEADFASQGFLALIGRDVLSHCILTYDGPADRFILQW